MTEPLLEVQGLKQHFPIHGGVLYRRIATVHAVDGVDLQIFPGETLGLVGESGCGKSTLGRSIARLYRPTEGQVHFRGHDITRFSKSQMRPLRRHMQMIFQDPYESLNPRHTVGEILTEPFVIHQQGTDAERQVWVTDLLKRVGLGESAKNRYPHEFSGGQRQRIGIARAIAQKPQLVICDEPVSALDVSIQSQVINLLLDLQRDLGLTYLFIAHDLAVVRHVSDRVAVMYLGKIVELTDADRILQSPLHPYTKALSAAVPIPDPSVQRRHKPLEGEVPSPLKPPSGCRFHTRCPFVVERCRQEVPALRTIPTGETKPHQVACHRAEELAGKSFSSLA